MQKFHSFSEIALPTASVGTVGTFDGVHLGHQSLLRAVVDDAHSRGLLAAVVTFFPSPRVVLGRAPALYLTLPDEKAQQMETLGVDVLLTMTFNRETIQTSAAEFVRLMLHHLHIVSLWIGHDFALGNKRQGDAAYLKEQGAEHGFVVNVIAPISAGQAEVSSTRVRAALANGDVREATLCLGRPFRVTGTRQDAVRLRVPEQHVVPAPGVYRVLVSGAPGRVNIPAEDRTEVICLDQPATCETPVGVPVDIDFLEQATD
jgi:riboflavin kinase/FMN adenylyltransferase